jgi:hypothetical protein
MSNLQFESALLFMNIGIKTIHIFIGLFIRSITSQLFSSSHSISLSSRCVNFYDKNQAFFYFPGCQQGIGYDQLFWILQSTVQGNNP